MNRLLILLFLGTTILTNAQTDQFSLPSQNPDTIKLEFEELFKELSIKHPGFYRYREQAEFDAYIDSTLKTIDKPINELEILRKVKPIFAKIGCLHTGIYLSEASSNQLDTFPNCIPFTLYKTNGKFYIWKTFGKGNSLKVGDEVSKINGREIEDIYAILLENIPMDGYNQTGKYKLLQYTFPKWYCTVLEIADEFGVELANGKQHRVKAVMVDEVLSYEQKAEEPMSMEIIEEIAVIKIPSFANSYFQANDQKFKREIKTYLKIIAEKEIEKILFDVRGNTGGSDSNPAWLTSFFFDAPYRYWDRIEVTEPIAKDVSGLSRLFYGKPKSENGRWLWSDKGLISKEFKYTQPQKPAKSPFKGQVYILADGLCFSSCSDFVAIMQTNQKATVIGEETGGGYQGNTSGLIPNSKLPSGLVVDIPLLKYVNAVELEKNVGRGTIPDIELKPKFEEIIDEKAYLKKVIEIIKDKP